MGKTQRAIDLLSDQRFVDLDANLHYFAEKYDAVLARHDEDRDTMATVRGTPFRRVAQIIRPVYSHPAGRGAGDGTGRGGLIRAVEADHRQLRLAKDTAPG